METETALPVFKKRSAKSTARKVAPPPKPASDSSSASEDEGEAGRVIKRRKTTGKVITSSTADTKSTNTLEGAHQFSADRSNVISANEDATKRSNWYEDEEATAKAPQDDLSAKNLLGTSRSKPSFLPKDPNASVPKHVGPMKAPTNVRTITVTDYAPDVCKDYKKTGFCGFGDSCKFLHAREDYAAGWKLDQQWETSGGDKKAGTVVASADKGGVDPAKAADDAELEKIPFACIICKKGYNRPVVTKCGHYFCESCALGRYRKNPNCAACGAGTNGVFNGAKRLKELLERKREREKRVKKAAKEKAKADGLEVSSSEEDDEED